jgi:hypothetical protein
MLMAGRDFFLKCGELTTFSNKDQLAHGITAGQKGATVIRKGESRRRGSFGKAQ